MKPYFYTAVLIITILLPLSTHANTFCVSDATGLQTALTTAAGNGEDDTVQIEQGTYVGSFIYASTEAFSLTVEGGYTSSCASRVVDPANTVLDANGTGSVLVFSAPSTDANLEVDGLTLQNGVAGNGRGGGIYTNSEGNIILSNNTITTNSSNEFGGGIYIPDSASVTLINNTITENSSYTGGGVYAFSYNGSFTFNNNSITENTANNIGGGIYGHAFYGSPILFTNNNINYNDANDEGGGVHFIANSSLGFITFSENTITGNNGGGIYIPDSASVTFINNTMTENLTGQNGGAFSVIAYSSVSLINNSITKNSANQNGGAIYTNLVNTDGSISLTNNTVTGNSTIGDGGIYIRLVYNSSEAIFTNNIIWNNTATGLGNDLYIDNDGNGDYIPSTVNLYNNNFDQSTDGTYIELPFTIDPSNLDNEDPLFVDAPNDDYHLTDLSPCIDTGRLEGAPADDMDGHSRPQGDGVDIGADEYIPPDTSFCRGLADYDSDVDAQDVAVFLSHFGRSIFSNPCPPDGPAPVAKTGQTTSYATGDDGDHQRGVALVTPRFTDNGDGTVLDHLTGLIWLKDANCFSVRTWSEAISDCNGLADGSCGLSDGSQAGAWRLANRIELLSLIDLSQHHPALPIGHFFENLQAENIPYWSSTSNALNNAIAWTVYPEYGSVGGNVKESNYHFVWPVRGGH